MSFASARRTAMLHQGTDNNRKGGESSCYGSKEYAADPAQKPLATREHSWLRRAHLGVQSSWLSCWKRAGCCRRQASRLKPPTACSAASTSGALR